MQMMPQVERETHLSENLRKGYLSFLLSICRYFKVFRAMTLEKKNNENTVRAESFGQRFAIADHFNCVFGVI